MNVIISLSVSQSGNVVCVFVEEWKTVSTYSHSVGVRKVFPDLNGTRLVFIDDKNGGFLLSPANVSTYGYCCLSIRGVPYHTVHNNIGIICNRIKNLYIKNIDLM